ncbi:tatD related DNase domain-containing protein [Ditylenchus destructor]|uniref:TatD related DNase domain-containing protein n=1 Tax=Ditylenchus destructor TaxID=166010 RepID=A0AAD4R9X1_9BILA|nr:tatD related DNase domain-containing protein [Ditylenchus destructor]
MIDCHCHLADEEFANDIDEVIDRAKQSGVTGAIVVAEFASDFDRVLQLSEMYQGFLFPCLGLHPVQRNFESVNVTAHYESMDIEKKIRQESHRLCGIGEVGLDFTPRYLKNGDDDKTNQREVFRRQIKLANEFDLPVNVHSRSAGKPTIDFLIENGATKVLLHAFSGNVKSARPGIEHGFHFSVPPSFTISTEKKDLIEAIPTKQLCLETDSPVLGPSRDQRNEPKNVELSAKFIAEVKKLTVEDVIRITTANAKNLFKLL